MKKSLIYWVMSILTVFVFSLEVKAAAQEILLEGTAEGKFCGMAQGEVLKWTCLEQGGKEQYLLGHPEDPKQFQALSTAPHGAPIIIDFQMIRFGFTLDPNGDEFPTHAVVTGVRLKKK